MSVIDSLITDRVGGHYNATDLNRVGEAVQYIADRMNQAGYAVSVAPKTDWTMTDIPMQEQMERYLQDVATLRNALAIGAVPPVPSDMDGLTVIEANDIESILVAVEDAIISLSSIFIRAGMPWAVAGNQIYIAN